MRLLLPTIYVAFISVTTFAIPYNTPPETPWFIEHLTFAPVELPQGILVSDVSEGDSYSDAFDYVVIKNLSSTPLFLIETPDDEYETFEFIISEFPMGTGPMYKVVDGKAYFWKKRSNDSGTGYNYAWGKETSGDDLIWVFAYMNRIRTETSTVMELEMLNKVYEERPDDVEIPKPQNVFLPMIYGSDALRIPMMVSYTLNKNYISLSEYTKASSFYYYIDIIGIACVYLSPLLLFALALKF